MSHIDRRKFLQLTGAAAVTTASLTANINKALAIKANKRTGTINDVEHIVILMQENRPFDHHFGTLRGVRGAGFSLSAAGRRDLRGLRCAAGLAQLGRPIEWSECDSAVPCQSRQRPSGTDELGSHVSAGHRA